MTITPSHRLLPGALLLNLFAFAGGCSCSEEVLAPVLVAPGAPTQVSAVPGRGSVGVFWQPPANDGGSEISGYVVTFTPGEVSLKTDASTRNMEVTGLENGVSYTFAVAATNATGTGRATLTQPVTPFREPDAPGAVSASASDRAATVTWEAPAFDGGSAITGYTVTSTADAHTRSVGADTFSVLVDGLANGTEYTFTVVATNAAGDGAGATTQGVTPREPAVVSSFEASSPEVAADGRSLLTLTVLAKTETGTPVADLAVTITSSESSDVFSEAAGSTDAQGRFTTRVSATVTGARSFEAALGPPASATHVLEASFFAPWNVAAGGSGADERGIAVASEAGGQVLVAGTFSSGTTIGSTQLSHVGARDVFVAKLSAPGEWLWAVSGGSTGDDVVSGIALDDDGDAIVVGHFSGTASFGAHTLESSGGEDVFVAKVSADGAWLWAVGGGSSTQDDRGLAVSVGPQGDAVVTGTFQGSASFGDTTLSGEGTDVFAAKVSAEGEWLWAVRAGGADDDDAQGVAVDGEGNAWVTGAFRGTASFGAHELVAEGDADVFVAKVSPDGAWSWAVSAGGEATDQAAAIAVEEEGAAVVTGVVGGAASFGASTLEEAGVFVARVSAEGAWRWTVRGGAAGDLARGLDVDATGNVFVSGTLKSEATRFGAASIRKTGGESDAFVAIVSPQGEWRWVERIGGGGVDHGGGLTVDEQGRLFVTGHFEAKAAFNDHLRTPSGADLFVAQLLSTGDWPVQPRKASAGQSSLVASTETVVTGREDAVTFTVTVKDSAGVEIPNAWVTFSSEEPSDEFSLVTAKTDVAGRLSTSLHASVAGERTFAADVGVPVEARVEVTVTLIDPLTTVQLGGTEQVTPTALAFDSQGNMLVSGSFTGSVTLGSTTLTANGSRDAFVGKVSPFGQWLWITSAGGTGSDDATAVAVDAEDNVIVAGNFLGEVSFGAIERPVTQRSSYVAKLSPDGEWLAVAVSEPTGEGSSSMAYGVGIDSAGNVWVGGTFSGTASFGSMTRPATEIFEAYVAKLSANLEWQSVSTGGSWSGIVTGLTVSAQGEVLVAGSYQRTLSLGSHLLTAKGDTEAFVAKLSPDGEWLWALSAGGTGPDYAAGIAVDGNGDVWLGGAYWDGAAFGSTVLTAKGQGDAFVAKVSSVGEWLWAVSAGGSGFDVASALTVDASGAAFVTGYGAQMTFGPFAITSAGSTDLFVARLSSDGQWEWVLGGGGRKEDAGSCVAIDPAGNVRVGVYFREAATIHETSYVASGTRDLLVLTIPPDGP